MTRWSHRQLEIVKAGHFDVGFRFDLATAVPAITLQISVTIPINRLKRCRFAVSDTAISSLSKRLKERNKLISCYKLEQNI